MAKEPTQAWRAALEAERRVQQTEDTPRGAVDAVADPRETERHRLLLEQSTDLISRHTPGDWRFIYASPAITTLLGYAPEEVLGHSSYEFFHPDDARTYKERAPSVVYERGFYTNTYRFRHKDGHYVWFETTSRTLRDAGTGRAVEILCVSRDVTRRIRSEQATRRLAQIVELTTDLVAFIDVDGRLTYLNEAARRLLGIPYPEQQYHGLGELFTPASYRLLIEKGLPAARARGDWRGETYLRGPGPGQDIPVSQVLLAHRASDGTLEYFSTIARDMRERRQVEEQARRHQQEMAHAARLITLGEMATGLAHELNQPLAAIVNYAQGCARRLESGTSPEALRQPLAQGLAHISTQARRAGEIIRRLRGFVRKSEYRRGAVDVNQLVTEMVDFCAPDARRYRVPVHTELDSDLPAVRADPVQIQQVVLNLLRNALEASALPDGREAAAVTVRSATADDGTVLVEVRDHGHGLPADPEQVFEQFFTTKREGLGLGLAISRSIVEAHGGRLGAGTAPGGGAVFRFTLPVKV